MTSLSRTRRRRSGQALIEMALVIPFLLALILGVVDVCLALFQSNVIKNFAREGSNLISRNRTIQDAEGAINAAAVSGPVRIDANTRVFLSVVTLGSSGANNNVPIIINRHSIGSLTATSALGNPPQGAYGGAPNYAATSVTSSSIRVAGALPNGYVLTAGEVLYVTEVFTNRTSVYGFVPMPDVLYSAAFF